VAVTAPLTEALTATALILSTPDTFTDAMQTAMKAVKNLPMLRKFADVLDLAKALTGPITVQQEQANYNAVHRMVRQTVLAEYARQAVGETFATFGDASSVRDYLMDATETEQGRDPSADAFAALSDLRTSAWEDLTAKADEAPTVRDYTLDERANVYLLAARLYDDPTRGDQIQDRNGILHSGFAGPGTVGVLTA